MDYQPMNPTNQKMPPASQTPGQMPNQMPSMPPQGSSPGKKAVVAIIAIVVIVLIAVAAWYFAPLISFKLPSLPSGTQSPADSASGAPAAGAVGDTTNDIANDLSQTVDPAGLNDDLDSLSKDLQNF